MSSHNISSKFSSIYIKQVSVCLCRCHGADRFSVCAGSGISGERFCHLGHQKSEVPADPAHAAHGSTRRHLETPGICGLRPQQGDPRRLPHFSLYLQEVRSESGSSLTKRKTYFFIQSSCSIIKIINGFCVKWGNATVVTENVSAKWKITSLILLQFDKMPQK